MEVITMDSKVYKDLVGKIQRIADFVAKAQVMPKEENEVWLDSNQVADALNISTRTLQRKRLLNYILCIRFFIEVHSIVSASRFFICQLISGLLLSVNLAFSRFFLHFPGTVPIIFSIHPVAVPSGLCLIWVPDNRGVY